MQVQEQLAADPAAETFAGSHGSAPSGIAVALLTGGFDRPYAFGLSDALVSKGVRLDVIGAEDLEQLARRACLSLNFFNLYGDQRRKMTRAARLFRYLNAYGKLFRYAASAEPRVFHILWNNRFQLFDRTLLMLYYRLLGKRIVLTAHNVNTAHRDGKDSALNRLTLAAQYRLVDHIFVHTDKMKDDLLRQFGVKESKLTVIPFGINNSVPDTSLSSSEAKQYLGIGPNEKTMLFFGGIRPYKGLEYLAGAFRSLAHEDSRYTLIIAGEPKKEAVQYWREIEQTLNREPCRGRVILNITYVDDADTEIYFKAADVAVLPYTLVYQSGVLFLSYRFGTPVVVTDVGTLRNDVIPGETGYVCPPCQATSLASAIRKYFGSDLYRNLEQRRPCICAFAQQRNSWALVGQKTCDVYRGLLQSQQI